MSILSHQTIVTRLDDLFLTGHDSSQARTAGYDLRVGNEYYIDRGRLSRWRSEDLRELGRGQAISIEPHEVAVIRMAEEIRMPATLVGHLSLKLDVLLKGVIMSSQSQIDAGYEGPIYVLLYNPSSVTVRLDWHLPLVRVEFAQLDWESEEPYDGDYKPDSTLSNVIERPLSSSLADLQEQQDRVTHRMQNLALGGVLTLFVTALFTFFAIIQPILTDAAEAKESAEQLSNRTANLEGQLHEERQESATLQGRIEEFERRLANLDVSASTSTTLAE